MSDTWLVTLYVAAGLLEAGGLIVVALDLRSTIAAARRWRNAALKGEEGTSWGQIEGLNSFLDNLAGSHQKRRVSGVLALLLGLVIATVANVASSVR